jgi:hypothetical protein
MSSLIPSKVGCDEQPFTLPHASSDAANYPGETEDGPWREEGSAQNEEDQGQIAKERGAAHCALPCSPVGSGEEEESDDEKRTGPALLFTGQHWIEGLSNRDPPCLKARIEGRDQGEGQAEAEGSEEGEGVSIYMGDPDEAIQL